MSPEAIINLIKSDFQDFVGNFKIKDDITILIMQKQHLTGGRMLNEGK